MPAPLRERLTVTGIVQGVGFRPHAFRLAGELGLAGFVRNGPDGVTIEVEGAPAELAQFARRLREQAPAPARIARIARQSVPPRGAAGFVVADSASGGGAGAWPLPDLATCPACRADIFGHGRHAGYAFTACAVCGPRFTVMKDLPYDRERTALAAFPLCPACRRDYRDPADRRFHAETQACPHCGPSLHLLAANGKRIAVGAASLPMAADRVRSGGIVAVKGIGGFHLLARADDARAVGELRRRKQRPSQPFAVLFPDVAAALAWCEAGAGELAALASAAAPIVLLRRAPGCGAADKVAPGQSRLGAMLPYAPLHHLLLAELALPLVATSANVSGEPLLYRDADVPDGLRTLADVILSHNRPILRPVEDSVVQVVAAGPMVLRLGRGEAPLAIPLGPSPPLLALGGRLKNAPAVTVGNCALLGPHLGDLDHPATLAAHRALVADLCRMHRLTPLAVACDAHPEDLAEAQAYGLPVIRVQHHVAHVAAAIAEHGLAGPVLGVAWDGAGYGPDGTVWGGEFLRLEGARWQRVGRLRPFPLPGGDAAAREPGRAAAGVLAETFGADLADWPAEAAAQLADPRWLALCRIAPRASSAGRLFDAAAWLLGLCRRNTFEGEAAMALETCAERAGGGDGYWFEVTQDELDWRPAIRALLADPSAPAERAARFYRGLIAAAAALVRGLGVADVVLTGGCFQSRLLVDGMAAALAAAGLRVHGPARVPPGDGGLALGQLEWARRVMAAG